ncbi:MAG TPA: hypothetical protein VE547_05820 [Mycobacteriales bacterium]|jgi:hypothetical protein|nr:hypothetical protein [Mycobacteriales bacterium]
MDTVATRRRADIRAIAAQTLEHCRYHAEQTTDAVTGATSLTQALILAAGGTVHAGRARAREPREAVARRTLHTVARELLAEAGVEAPTGTCPCRALARWEAGAEPAATYRLIGARPAASHHLRVSRAA